jgi:hypothetical protein
MLTFEEEVLCENQLQRFGSELEPDPEPTWIFGHIPDTSNLWITICVLSSISAYSTQREYIL